MVVGVVTESTEQFRHVFTWLNKYPTASYKAQQTTTSDQQSQFCMTDLYICINR